MAVPPRKVGTRLGSMMCDKDSAPAEHRGFGHTDKAWGGGVGFGGDVDIQIGEAGGGRFTGVRASRC
jgi:hypothetical protein